MGKKFTVLILRADRVYVNIRTENGYKDGGYLPTASGSGTPSATFSIPPNQGSSIEVCVANDIVGSVLGLGNCQRYDVTGNDMSVNMPAGWNKEVKKTIIIFYFVLLQVQ